MSYYSGYSVDKSTSRVLNPPGGKSNNIFGTAEPTTTATTLNDKTNMKQSSVYGTEQSAAHAAQVTKHNQQKSSVFESEEKTTVVEQPTMKQQPSQLVQQAAPMMRQDKSKRQGFNPITGVPYDENKEDKKQQQEEKAKEETQASSKMPFVRVTQPPGGRSTKLW